MEGHYALLNAGILSFVFSKGASRGSELNTGKSGLVPLYLSSTHSVTLSLLIVNRPTPTYRIDTYKPLTVEGSKLLSIYLADYYGSIGISITTTTT
eukprot:scaffold12325_cov72-Skeletonema_dohrnii-CCMP3373.AAC.1